MEEKCKLCETEYPNVDCVNCGTKFINFKKKKDTTKDKSDFSKYLDEQLKNPDFKKEWDALQHRKKYIMNSTEILASLLDCGSSDISILATADVDFCEIFEEIKMLDFNFTLETIFERIIQKGIKQLKYNIENKINNESNSNITEKLEVLSPDNDIVPYFNHLNSSVQFVSDEVKDIYLKYLEEELEEFENLTGFSLL